MVLQHNSPYSAPCEGVAPSRYFRRQTFISATPAMKRRLITPPKILSAGTPAFLVLTALRHSGRAFTAHVAESAKVSMGRCPSPMRGCYTLALPCLLFITCSDIYLVKESRRKILLAKRAKIFAPLTTMSS